MLSIQHKEPKDVEGIDLPLFIFTGVQRTEDQGLKFVDVPSSPLSFLFSPQPAIL